MQIRALNHGYGVGVLARNKACSMFSISSAGQPKIGLTIVNELLSLVISALPFNVYCSALRNKLLSTIQTTQG